ncbi:MAG TPA: trypsin-like serine protease [Polyangiaceae bacterium LLY-WYZ-15_(1-7)]|nr:trypsin-like serine protease [Polyangiaceae bacterium LLY-WYZ-15_(1-7)]HJL04664.1 trypsin-like serine protease [Polyangiaceae bacterium LLY-WYZ-15_(1-7)]HJL09665.1 trypsin-like serine protease [Polyangiaceae bacterium LLY-WYZ-15_(1-7)]HJL26909.1 trypsin-like serine protease [Polyangiaceae bacterium LLY-WYZ-15_(1-7)]HJL49576.1 trypsin-like serine protease [Polyangiaceae bacterium LLY-WYZ-15_(1-7)]
MRTSRTWTLVAALCGACVADAPATPAAEGANGTPVAVALAAGVELTESAEADLDSLTHELEGLVERLGYEGPPIRVTYEGVGEVVEIGDEGDPGQYVGGPESELDDDAPLEDDPDYSEWDAVSVSTGNEFHVRYPRELLERADEDAFARGLHLGSVDRDGHLGEEIEEPAPTLEGEREGELKGWSNGQDTRSLRGTYDVAQTHRAFRKLVAFGGCSGTLVGPKHIVTAAHCIRDVDDRRWFGATARAGQSGSAWRDSVSFSTSNTWYWTPSQFRNIADGLDSVPYSATPYDIGLIVTHDDRMGNTVGWMGWYWWASNSEFGDRARYNRGYPSCSRSNAPAGCQVRGLYGDSRWCASGNYSSTDSDGIERRFRFHCDASGGHSGSSLYTYLNGDTLAVTSVVSWEHCHRCTPDEGNFSSSILARPNTAVRITKEYSGVISALRNAFP